MARTFTALSAAFLILTGARFQDEKKPDAAAADDAAKAAVKAFKEKWSKARTESDFSDAITVLKDAEPHRLVRGELIIVLEGRTPPVVRTDAVSGLGKYKKDAIVCDALIRRAREERKPEALDLRKRCLRTFGDIAPFAKSVDLLPILSDPDFAIVREAIEAAEEIKSVRVLPQLMALYGELDRIRDDDGGEQGPGVPGAGGPAEDKNSKRKKKEELLEPTKKAIAAIWTKIDKRTFKTYTEANRAMGQSRAEIKKAQEKEEEEDKKQP
jgi:hypothetical protein